MTLLRRASGFLFSFDFYFFFLFLLLFVFHRLVDSVLHCCAQSVSGEGWNAENAKGNARG